jgi:hypothetical protein
VEDDSAEGALVDEAARILRDGPLLIDDLVEALNASGALEPFTDIEDYDDLVDSIEDVLDSYEGFWITPKGYVGWQYGAKVGAVFTHRVNADELESGRLRMQPDLDPINSDVVGPLPLRSGGALDVDLGDATTTDPDTDIWLTGPSGWLDGFAPGDVIALRRGDDDAVIERPSELGEGEAEVEWLRQAFASHVQRPGIGEAILVLALDVMTEHPDAFRSPVRPLGELLADAGLECRGDFCGPAGTEWQVHWAERAGEERRMLAERYQLDVCCLEALDVAMDGWNELVVRTSEPVDWRDVVDALQHGDVAPAFADHVLRDLDEQHPVLDEFVAKLRATSPNAAAAAGYLAARNLERGGDVLAAETALQGAVRADPEFVPALEELAWYVADRGDVDQAISLLRRSGIRADDPELELLESLRPARNVVGRNERCPCGSGRKFKDCCLRNPRLSIDQRSDWLLHKLWTFTLRPHRQRRVLSVAMVLALDDDEDTIDELLDSGLPMDLVAFEDGLASDFLDERGALLPEDDRAMLASWLDEPRTLWEVVEHERAHPLVVRNAATGELVTVTVGHSERHEPGELVYARVGAIGDRRRFVGVPIVVAPDARSSVEALIASAPSARAIASWFSRLADEPEA